MGEYGNPTMFKFGQICALQGGRDTSTDQGEIWHERADLRIANLNC